MGRRKIAIEPLTDDRNRTVTFVKRKAGLFKKAHELAVLCQVDLAVIIVGNNNKIYEFSSVDTQELIQCYNRSKPYESKSPENYGKYKKKARLRDSRSQFSPKEELPDVPVDDADSDYDSDSPEPKRAKTTNPKPQKQHASPPLYSTGPPVGPQLPSFGENQNSGSEPKLQLPQNQNQQNQQNHVQPQHQRPILRVQIPSDAKNSSSNDSAKTITAVDTNQKKPVSEGDSGGNPHHGRFEGFPKFKGTPSKNTPSLPVPTISKSQTSSPSSAVAPQLPRNSGMPFFSSLPQASPGGYQPAILPTPVLNQVFNQQYMAQPSALPHNESGETNEGSSGSHNGHGDNDDAHKYKPTFPGQFANPEQTPMSALPSRYVNDIFPSPSNLYPSQDWPHGMTSFPPNMPHYFVGMVPSGSGTAPISGNPMFMNARGSLSSAMGSGPGPGAGSGNANQRRSSFQGQHEESSSGQNSSGQIAQQSSSTSPQHSDIYMSSQFNFKK